jgi:hypothetical protein
MVSAESDCFAERANMVRLDAFSVHHNWRFFNRTARCSKENTSPLARDEIRIQIRRRTRAVRRAKDKNGFAKGLSHIEKIMISSGYLRHSWKKFRETLLEPPTKSAQREDSLGTALTEPT